jgi:RNA polymerase sigma-70 factor (ECF subfamily)
MKLSDIEHIRSLFYIHFGWGLSRLGLDKLLKTKQFLDEIAASVKNIIYASFPKTTPEEREDIEQEVKLKIWERAASGKKIGNLRSYLWKVVYTTALDVISNRLNTASQEEIANHIDSLNISRFQSLLPDLLLEQKELTELLRNGICSLPPRRKTVLELYLAGMNIEEMAKFLGWEENQVRHLLYRGIHELEERTNELGKKTKTETDDKINMTKADDPKRQG